MTNDELLKSISAIYKFISVNGSVHKNVLRKKLIWKGKIASKEKFSKLLDLLTKSGALVVEKENVSINPKILKAGVLQSQGDNFYVVIPGFDKKYRVDKNIAQNYRVGDVVDLVLENIGDKKQTIVLGKSKSSEIKIENSVFPKDLKLKENENNAEVKGNLVLGRVVKLSHDDLVFIPNKKSFVVRQIPILNNKEEWASFQDKICVMDMVDLDAPILGGHIVSVKGDAGNPIHEYDAIAENYGAIMSWEGVNEEIDKIPLDVNIDPSKLISEVDAKHNQSGNIVDLRHLPFTTVDPATCKDMDDAIYSTINENGDIVCYTAVANVTKYVDLDSEIGKRYIQGGFTIYAPNKAYNILPTKLSTGICSLNPDEDRLAFVVKTVIDKNTGKVKNSRIYDAVIRSQKKYSYEEAQQIVDDNNDKITLQDLENKIALGENLTKDEQVLMNYYAGQIIKIGFENRKMIRFVANKEREIVFDDDMKDVVDINTIPHLYYHEVIEAFMITANESTAKFAKDNKLDNIFRVHEEPNPKKTERANEFFRILGVEFDGDLSAEGTRALIDLIRDSANEEVINKFLIKMQSRAIYSDKLYSPKKDKEVEELMGERISHYALQSPHYSHTTSPIRRVPDYITQYNILANLHGTEPISAKRIKNIIEIENERQKEVDQAEKDFEDISSVLYCEKHIGETLKGRVTKIRYASPEESYEDNIIVIVKNEEKGINAEIPLSQILGRASYDCELSEQRCAVFDKRGNVVLSLCKPVEFIIESADRKLMRVVGKTNKEMVSIAEEKANKERINYLKHQNRNLSVNKRKEKDNRSKRFEDKRNHNVGAQYYDLDELDK